MENAVQADLSIEHYMQESISVFPNIRLPTVSQRSPALRTAAQSARGASKCTVDHRSCVGRSTRMGLGAWAVAPGCRAAGSRCLHMQEGHLPS